MKFLASFILLFNLIAIPVYAETTPAPTTSGLRQGILGNLGTASGDLKSDASSGDNALVNAIGGIVKAILSLLGVVTVLLFIYGGFMWMTASGDEKKVTKAKDTLRNAVIGLVIVLTSFAVASFVLNQLEVATTSSLEADKPQQCSTNSDCDAGCQSQGKLGWCFDQVCKCS